MVASDSFAEFLREQLAPLGRLTLRRMFGKTGVFCDGVMLGMVTDNTLYFRVDEENRAVAAGETDIVVLEVSDALEQRNAGLELRTGSGRLVFSGLFGSNGSETSGEQQRID